MSKKVVKITTDQLRSIVLEEKAKFESRLAEAAKIKRRSAKLNEAEKFVKEPKKVEADGYAQTLEKEIDYMKALKIKETQVRKALTKIQEAKKVVRDRIVKKLA